MKAVCVIKNSILSFLLIAIFLHGFLMAKNETDEHPEGGPTLTLINETSFTLDFPFSFKPEYKSWSDLKKVFTAAKSISDLPPSGKHTESFEGLNYGPKGTTFEVLSAAWPRGKRLVVHIPKTEGPVFTPFAEEEHEVYGATLGINYDIKWSDQEPNIGWEITFFEEEVITKHPEKKPSPEDKKLHDRLHLGFGTSTHQTHGH